jgi:hypothetical protein
MMIENNDGVVFNLGTSEAGILVDLQDWTSQYKKQLREVETVAELNWHFSYLEAFLDNLQSEVDVIHNIMTLKKSEKIIEVLPEIKDINGEHIDSVYQKLFDKTWTN